MRARNARGRSSCRAPVGAFAVASLVLVAVIAMHAVTAAHGAHASAHAADGTVEAPHVATSVAMVHGASDAGASVAHGSMLDADAAWAACAFVVLVVCRRVAARRVLRRLVSIVRGPSSQVSWAPDPPVPRPAW